MKFVYDYHTATWTLKASYRSAFKLGLALGVAKLGYELVDATVKATLEQIHPTVSAAADKARERAEAVKEEFKP